MHGSERPAGIGWRGAPLRSVDVRTGATDRDTYLVQGYVVTDPEALSQMRVPDGETVVEVPRRLMKYLPPEEQHGEGDG